MLAQLKLWCMAANPRTSSKFKLVDEIQVLGPVGIADALLSAISKLNFLS